MCLERSDSEEAVFETDKVDARVNGPNKVIKHILTFFDLLVGHITIRLRGERVHSFSTLSTN